MNKILSLIISGLVSALSLSVHSTETQNGEYVWTFLNGEPWPVGYQQDIGKPNNLTWNFNDYPADFFARINNALPERAINKAFLTDDAGSTISLVEEGEVFITFVHEGAGYRNSFGYFIFDPQNPPQTPSDVREIVVFPNLSYPHLTNGHRLSLGTFPAGTHIGFFIAANGYWYDTGVRPKPVPYYYSLQHLNPEQDPSLRQHAVLLLDEEVSEVVLAFEDLPRTWGDNDFNDAVFAVKVTPESALATNQLKVVPQVNDKDADGVIDAEDEFPDDYQRAFSSYYPSQKEWVTLAFEDNWPNQGDYDLNDLVIRERLQVIYNANGKISGFKLSGYIDARGAANHNGFGLRLLNTDNDIVSQANIVVGGQSFAKRAENYQSDTVLILWQDSHEFTQTNGQDKCAHFNTVITCEQFAPIPFELDVSFVSALTALPHSSLDFFIFRSDDRSLEIHFADYPPTDLFNFGRFGRLDDTSEPQSGRYFRNEHNLPWALKINSDWRYPREYIDVLWAYPNYEIWVESAGQQAQDWYQSSERPHHIY
ncbi:LruC domain-containing protein [Paraglaciecola sp. 25GB23A]|uniref:LruC domain-containing protein n=1 Tax=Paraglaciecola sp. 25GB23A TaxID=3156068 RepID=UPI0032AEDD13